MPWISRRRAHAHKSTLSILTLLAVMMLSLPAHASTWDDIARLEQAKEKQTETTPKDTTQRDALDQQPGRVALPSHGGTVRPSPVLQLPSGLSVPVADWTVVLFMQSTCSYCQQFDPVLAQLSQQSGLPVFTYTLDGKGDAAFPKALPASPEVMNDFFGYGLPVATPTTFLVNVNTMATYPLLQGAVTADVLLARLDEVFTLHYQQAPTSPTNSTNQTSSPQTNQEVRYGLP